MFYLTASLVVLILPRGSVDSAVADTFSLLGRFLVTMVTVVIVPATIEPWYLVVLVPVYVVYYYIQVRARVCARVCCCDRSVACEL